MTPRWTVLYMKFADPGLVCLNPLPFWYLDGIFLTSFFFPVGPCSPSGHGNSPGLPFGSPYGLLRPLLFDATIHDYIWRYHYVKCSRFSHGSDLLPAARE
jgi:hypothetical protein